jgi:hypothetical protein
VSEFKLTPIGVLNKFEQSSNAKFFSRDDSSIGHLRNVVREVAVPSAVPDTQYFLGEVLYVFPDSASEKAADTMPSVLERWFGVAGFKLKTVQIIARIPELHAFLPVPKTYEDLNIIKLYPTFSALNEGVPLPEVGQIVYLDFKNRTNLEGGIYVGTFESSQGNVNGSPATHESAHKSPGSAKSTFNNGTPANNSLIQLPPFGPGYVRKTSREFMTWGIPKLISAIETACANGVERIAQITGQSPGDPRLAVVVKDLNSADGKPVKSHKTHWQGKSVDFGYFYRTSPDTIENLFINNKNLPNKWVNGLRELKEKHSQWDLEANWQFTLAMLEVPQIIQILVDQLYCVELERKAREHFAGDTKALNRALRIIQFTGNHDNHFHVNI